MNPQEFAAKIRAKYPGAYDNVPDLELTQKVIEKYPVYSSQVKLDTPAQPQGKDLLEKTGDVVNAIFPGKQIGKIIGSTAQNVYQGVKNVATGKDFFENNNMDLGGVTPLQAIGDTAAGVASVAGLKVPAATSVLGSAAQIGGLGALSSGGSSLSVGNDIKTAALDAFKGGLTGAAIGGATAAIGKGLIKLSQKGPEAITNNALRVTQKIKDSGKNPIPQLIKDGEWGSLGYYSKTADKGINEANSVISKKLAANNLGIKTSTILEDAVDSLTHDYGSLYSRKELEDIILKVPASKLFQGAEITSNEANALRQELDRTLGDRFFLSGQSAPINKDAIAAVANSLRKTVQNVSNTKEEFTQLAKWIRTKKIVDRAINIADGKYGLGLKDVLSTGVGVTTGIASGEDAGSKIKNAALYGLGAFAAERAATNPAILTGTAQLLSKLKDIPTDTAGKISKTVLIRLIGELGKSNIEAK